MKKLVAQQEAAKGALDLFVSVLRVARPNPRARELPRVSRQLRSHARATRRTKPAVGSQLGLVAVGRRISRAHSEEYTLVSRRPSPAVATWLPRKPPPHGSRRNQTERDRDRNCGEGLQVGAASRVFFSFPQGRTGGQHRRGSSARLDRHPHPRSMRGATAARTSAVPRNPLVSTPAPTYFISTRQTLAFGSRGDGT